MIVTNAKANRENFPCASAAGQTGDRGHTLQRQAGERLLFDERWLLNRFL